MSFSDARDLLWLAGISYSFAFTVGFLKTFKLEFMLLKDGPLVLLFSDSSYRPGSLLEGFGSTWLPTRQHLGTGSIYSLVIDSYLFNLKSFMALNLLGTFCAGLSAIAGIFSLSFSSADFPYWLRKDYVRLFS